MAFISGLILMQVSFADTMNLTITNFCNKDLCWESSTQTFNGSITSKKLSGGNCSSKCDQCIPSGGKTLIQIAPSKENDMAQISIGNADTSMSFITSTGSTGSSYCNRYFSHVNTCLIIFNKNNICSPVGSPSFRWSPGENEQFEVTTSAT